MARAGSTVAQVLRAALLGLCLSPLAAAAPAAALPEPQSDPELRAVVQRAIAEAECFADKYDSAVWYTLMEPRLRRAVPDRAERLEILKMVFCETRREGEQRLPPGLVMGLIEVESRFDRWAVSPVGAQGLMQVMPFWPEQLGMHRTELMHVAANIRMGTAILRHYLQTEHNDVRKALERYNGSVGRREYPDLVIRRWTYWNGADDLGRTLAQQTSR